MRGYPTYRRVASTRLVHLTVAAIGTRTLCGLLIETHRGWGRTSRPTSCRSCEVRKAERQVA